MKSALAQGAPITGDNLWLAALDIGVSYLGFPRMHSVIETPALWVRSGKGVSIRCIIHPMLPDEEFRLLTRFIVTTIRVLGGVHVEVTIDRMGSTITLTPAID